MKQNIIAVDFDGTLCENKWPEIGMPNEELIEYLKKRTGQRRKTDPLDIQKRGADQRGGGVV